MKLSKIQKDSLAYLKALNGQEWSRMTKQQKRHEWDRWNALNRATKRKTVVDPFAYNSLFVQDMGHSAAL